MEIKIGNGTAYLGDCLEVMKEIPDNSVDCIITDPPYELGFMGKSWDKTGIANNVELWQEALRALKPGGHLLAFSGTRTYHRMASAIEDAGFEVRDMIEWVYGSGFPKSLNIGKAVDKLQGNEREEIPNNRHGGGSSNISPERNNLTTTKGTSEWEGWGTALKPAHEPICIARKPLSEKTVAENCLKWGTGGINIDKSRVGTEKITTNSKGTQNGNTPIVPQSINFIGETHIGRFPANLIHDNSEEVRECFPDNVKGEIGRAGRKSSGNYKASSYKVGVVTETGFKDNGNASRFFKSIIYQTKASKSDRGDGNNHPTVKPIKLMEYLINMITREGQIVLDSFGGSFTTAVACENTGRKWICIEKDENYFNIGVERINNLSNNNLI